MDDTRFAKLKLFITIVVAFAGLQLCLQILSAIIVLYRNCARYRTMRKMKAKGLVYQSSDEEDDLSFRQTETSSPTLEDSQDFTDRTIHRDDSDDDSSAFSESNQGRDKSVDEMNQIELSDIRLESDSKSAYSMKPLNEITFDDD